MTETPKTHELKTLPRFFCAIQSGEKTFELRWDDRGFAVGDKVILREFTGLGGYTGRQEVRRVTFILSGFAGLEPGYVVMALGQLP